MYKELEIGFIKAIDKQKKIGIIIGGYHRDGIRFNIRNEYEKKLKRGDVIGYLADPGFWAEEASDVKFVADCLDDIKAWRRIPSDQFLWTLVRLGIPNLLQEELKAILDGRDELLKNIDTHIKTTNIDTLISAYKIKIITGSRHKAGDTDDKIWIIFESTTPTLGNRPIDDGEKYEYTYDKYINELLPPMHEFVLHEDASFPPWEYLKEYKKDKEKMNKHKKEAKKIETAIKINAKEKYNKEKHRIVLEKHLKMEIKEIIESKMGTHNYYTKSWENLGYPNKQNK